MYSSRTNRRYNTKRNNSFDTMINQLFKGGINEFVGTDFVTNIPAVNVLENADSFKINVAAPGLNKEDFKINLENDQLTIETKKEANTEKRAATFRRKEFDFQNFKRSFKLPKGVKVTEIGASYENGVLSIHLPKKEEAKEINKTIAIS